jgi:O-antigen/teichoic acid export membrane protein
VRVDTVSTSHATTSARTTAPPPDGAFATTVFSNVLANLARAAAVSLVTLLLPAYLTHRLPVAVYAAWVLILQLGAYVSYLDLGIQIGVSKFVAEYDALGDQSAAGRHASAGFALMILAGALGLGLTGLLAWQVPRLFSGMPANLHHEVRIGLILVGSSLSFGLVCAVYSAVFLGLQRYWIPTTITIVNRASFLAVVIAVVALRGNLAAMGLAVAVVNVATGILQIAAWWKKASHVSLSLKLLEPRIVKNVVRYCSLQSVSTLAMLCISGLDILLVGHYDYAQTAYYSIAILATNFVLLLVGSALGPLMPASSALSTQRSPVEMGDFLSQITRYTAVLLLVTGLPLIVCGFPLLRAWVGPAYAAHSLRYLQILVLANILRNLCAPYATLITATGRQAPALAAAIAEAVVNLGSSIYLASRFGAIGVAAGTFIGAFVGVSMHFAITMPFTRQTLTFSRSRLFLTGLLRPSAIGLPALILLPFWDSSSAPLNLKMAVVWSIGTLGIAWFFGARSDERSFLVDRFKTLRTSLSGAAIIRERNQDSLRGRRAPIEIRNGLEG